MGIVFVPLKKASILNPMRNLSDSYDISLHATARHERVGSKLVLNLKKKDEENRKAINLRTVNGYGYPIGKCKSNV